MNPLNNTVLTGRLVSDVKVFPNSDGSQKVRFTLAVKQNFKSGPDKKYGTSMIPVEAFLSKENVAVRGLGVYGNIHEGDLVTIGASIDSNNYEKNGAMVYGLVVRIESIQMLEGKAVTQKRQAEKAAAAARTNAAVATPYVNTPYATTMPYTEAPYVTTDPYAEVSYEADNIAEFDTEI